MQKMKLLPINILEIQGDTLLIKIIHRDTLIENREKLKAEGIEISN